MFIEVGTGGTRKLTGTGTTTILETLEAFGAEMQVKLSGKQNVLAFDRLEATGAEIHVVFSGR